MISIILHTPNSGEERLIRRKGQVGLREKMNLLSWC